MRRQRRCWKLKTMQTSRECSFSRVWPMGRLDFFATLSGWILWFLTSFCSRHGSREKQRFRVFGGERIVLGWRPVLHSLAAFSEVYWSYIGPRVSSFHLISIGHFYLAQYAGWDCWSFPGLDGKVYRNPLVSFGKRNKNKGVSSPQFFLKR